MQSLFQEEINVDKQR